MAECLRERGWDAVTSESGPGTLGIDLASEIPDAQADDRSIDLKQACPSEVGEKRPLEMMSDEQLSRQHDWALLTRHCLVDHGQRISEPPSREYFIANYYTDNERAGTTLTSPERCPAQNGSRWKRRARRGPHPAGSLERRDSRQRDSGEFYLPEPGVVGSTAEATRFSNERATDR